MTPWPDGRWPQAVREAIVRHLEACYPEEGCGVVLQSNPSGDWRVCPLRNASPCPAVAYAFSPGEWLALCIQAEARGERVVSVFHSHVDAPATFSGVDRDLAAPDGQPLLPDVSYLIASVHRGCVTWVSEYVWRDGDFQAQRV
ncbi:M67 family metallopeptidase [Myxococcus sp. K15C18031901]|uniref:Mov34/MPN/PAD-1 family protein n=1 Tax=Myxococcus dinghuensis TaxID=2906761 RepID=UPI0020A7EA2E|nr:Mov34/MPN/PAD-1 family protein [Myxococcus dinghuensis]MCP3100381.1 M67 family metallopeptidase [Myxococcus dinghuensis]